MNTVERRTNVTLGYSNQSRDLKHAYHENSFQNIFVCNKFLSEVDRQNIVESSEVQEPEPRSILKKFYLEDDDKEEEDDEESTGELENGMDFLSISTMSDDEEAKQSATSSKRVSFADAFAMSLCDIRNFTPSDDKMDLWSDCDYFRNHFLIKRVSSDNVVNEQPANIALCFKDPSSHPAFQEVFDRQNVILERCGTRERTITGIIQVKNIDYNKHVFIRSTSDKWRTVADTPANYLPNSNDGSSDRFIFSLQFPKNVPEMEFCIGYKIQSGEFWDNNHRKNYKVKDVLFTTGATG